MYDKNKIRIMAKMAVYDKRGFEKDAKSNHYFRHDFIYKKNMAMRFFIGVGCVFLAIFYVMYLFAYHDIDIFTMDYFAVFMRLITVAVIIMVAYSFIGMIVYTREFELSQRRIRKYFALMDELEGREKPAPKVKAVLREEKHDGADEFDEDEIPDVYRRVSRPIPYRIRAEEELYDGEQDKNE